MGQLDSPTTEDEEVIYKLYYKFFSEANDSKAKFLIPLDAASEFKDDSRKEAPLSWKKILVSTFQSKKERWQKFCAGIYRLETSANGL